MSSFVGVRSVALPSGRNVVNPDAVIVASSPSSRWATVVV